jgi:hypothetical protein
MVGRFYSLMIRTRRRQRLPPQPLRWFQNLAACLGESLSIRTLSKDGMAVAAILTLDFRRTMVYKYGCSDERFHHLGCMPLLFWETIQRARIQGMEVLDLGRSDPENSGLIQFKDHLGAIRSELKYYCCPPRSPAGRIRRWGAVAIRSTLSILPDRGLAAVGDMFYKHLG